MLPDVMLSFAVALCSSAAAVGDTVGDAVLGDMVGGAGVLSAAEEEDVCDMAMENRDSSGEESEGSDPASRRVTEQCDEIVRLQLVKWEH